MSAEPSNENITNRTRLELLDLKVIHLLDLFSISNSKMDVYINKTDMILQQLITGAAVRETKITDITDDMRDFKGGLKDCDDKVNDLEKKSNWWSGLNTALGLFANAVAGYFAVRKF